jgi:hypothetical protein
VEHGGVISNPHTLHVHPDDTLRVIAQRENLENSLTKTGVYTTSIEQVATPTINPDAVILTGNHHEIDVAIACATSGTSMSYTISTPDVIDTPTRTHGTIVNTNSTTIHLGPNQPTRIGHRVLRVMAFRLDMRDSDIAEGTYDHEGGN